MSKYTTELRFICENLNGLNESKGYSDVDNIINGAYTKIFDTNVEFFDETYKHILLKKILKHYYLREIGSEVYGIWKLWMNTKLEEIMPYYNQLYKSALIEYDPLIDTDIKKTANTEINKSGNRDQNNTNTRKDTFKINENNIQENNITNTNQSLFSDTPQGSISGLENMNYLSQAQKDSGSSKQDSSNTKTGNNENSSTNTENKKENFKENNVNDYIETLIGKSSGVSYANMIIEFRKTLLNIDMLVINEFENCFMQIW